MALFQKLCDVYFDAVKLREALDRIPDRCDCGDAEAHLLGSCCCAGAQLDESAGDSERRGCLVHLEQLSREIQRFEEDLRRERGALARDDEDGAVQQRVSNIEIIVERLSSTLGRLRIDLMSFRETCAHDVLSRIKASRSELDGQISALNSAL